MKSVLWCDIDGYENEYQINQFGEIEKTKEKPFNNQ